jgi:electron transfer flavoprotein alpha subunit
MNIKDLENRRVFVLIEREGLAIAPISFELLGIAKQIATDLGDVLCAVAVGHEVADISDQVSCFVDEIYCIDHPQLKSFNAETYIHALEQLYQKVNPDVILMGCTLDNLGLAPRLAYRMGVQVITDCVQIAVEPETGYLLCTKPVYGAKVSSVFKLVEKPYMITLRPKAVQAIDLGSGKGEIIQFDPIIDESLVKVKTVEKIREETVSLDRAEAIVAGGRGIRDAEGLEQLKELVKALRKYFGKVELGASRPLVDAHLVPSSRQIGLTGEKVAPEVYVAVGISGSLQHLTGILGAKKIVAINTDAKANIFKVADYGVIGSFEEVVPALKRRLEKLE